MATLTRIKTGEVVGSTRLTTGADTMNDDKAATKKAAPSYSPAREEWASDSGNITLRRSATAQTQQNNRYGAGNIDLLNRPQFINDDGSVSTVASRSFNIDGKETLLPSVWLENGKPYRSDDDNEIVQHYFNTG